MDENNNLSPIKIIRTFKNKEVNLDLDKDRNIKFKPRESMTGLYIGPDDIQRYINDYFDYGIYHMGDDECAEDRIERYWDEADGKEE